MNLEDLKGTHTSNAHDFLTLYHTRLATPYHFLGCFSLGAGFLGMRKRALMGCMLHKATGRHNKGEQLTRERQKNVRTREQLEHTNTES